MVKHLLALTVILAIQTGDSSCAPTPKACDLSFAGINVQDGRVMDTVTVVCDLRPTSHLLQGWIEYRPFDTWDAYDRTATTRDIPGTGRTEDSKPLRVTVSSPCLEGTYRTPGDRPDIEISQGCRGTVTEYVRPGTAGNYGYRIAFDNGAVFGTYLPAPWVIQLERPTVGAG